jgi:hypothetical protein
MTNAERETLEFSAPNTFTSGFFATGIPQVEVHFGAASHIGKVRSNNEDHYAVTDKDLFFHKSDLKGVPFESLKEGQRVSYTEARAPKGPRAENGG